MLPGVSFSSISSTGSCRTAMSQQRRQSKSKIRNSPLPFGGTYHVVSEPATSTSGVDDFVVASQSLSLSLYLSLPLPLSLSISMYASPFRVDVYNRATTDKLACSVCLDAFR